MTPLSEPARKAAERLIIQDYRGRMKPLDTLAREMVMKIAKRSKFEGREPVDQYLTHWFLDRALPRRLSEDSVMLTAVTAADLYPSDDWQYVFGMAHLRRRVGVYSIGRYFPRFWGEKALPGAREKALRRACKLVTHELGHCFGLRHCIEWECGMNGSNSLEESDRRPIHLCPVCLRKLHWNRRFDVVTRYRTLKAFYEAQGLAPEAAWILDRIARIEGAR